MDFKQYIDPNHPYFFYLLGGAILLIYILFSRRKLKSLGNEKLENNTTSDQDVKGHIPKGMEHFTGLDKAMQWKTVLLIVLMIIGLYLVFTQGSSMRNENGPVESVLEQGNIE